MLSIPAAPPSSPPVDVMLCKKADTLTERLHMANMSCFKNLDDLIEAAEKQMGLTEQLSGCSMEEKLNTMLFDTLVECDP